MSAAAKIFVTTISESKKRRIIQFVPAARGGCAGGSHPAAQVFRTVVNKETTASCQKKQVLFHDAEGK